MMKEERLSEALRTLPSAHPSPDFVDQVMARVRRSRPHRATWLQLSAYAALVAVGMAVGTWWSAGDRTEQQREAELEVLLQESIQLQREIARVREELARPMPVLYLGGTERLDVVLDLATLQRSDSTPPRAVPAVLPATVRSTQ